MGLFHEATIYLDFKAQSKHETIAKMLAQLSRKLIDPVFRNRLIACTNKKTALQILQEIK
jgi:PTS system fructose-specific IIC component